MKRWPTEPVAPRTPTFLDGKLEDMLCGLCWEDGLR